VSGDLVRASALAGRVVLVEESARDGAQGKTFMRPEFRVRLARATGGLFGVDGPRHVVFAAGFPAVCREEAEAVRRVAVEAEGAVSTTAVCRATEPDVRQAVATVAGTAHARVMLIVPASEAIADVMTHRPAAEALRVGGDLVAHARGLDDAVAVDVCLADASRAAPGLVAEHATRMTAAGAGTVILADTVGDQLPADVAAMLGELTARAGPDVVFASHQHDDLGLGLANTLEAARHGLRVLSGSWLGLAERTGLVATEQLLFLLAYRADRTAALLGAGAEPWWTAPDLTALAPVAAMVGEETGTPIGVTTPIVGGGVGTISTGTPFVRPELFQPFDPAQVGITPRIVLTHLASRRVVRAAAADLGVALDDAQAAAAMAWVKAEVYRTGVAVVAPEAFRAHLAGAPGAAVAS
jgi:2-isopropylmalate synthase